MFFSERFENALVSLRLKLGGSESGLSPRYFLIYNIIWICVFLLMWFSTTGGILKTFADSRSVVIFWIISITKDACRRLIYSFSTRCKRLSSNAADASWWVKAIFSRMTVFLPFKTLYYFVTFVWFFNLHFSAKNTCYMKYIFVIFDRFKLHKNF